VFSPFWERAVYLSPDNRIGQIRFNPFEKPFRQEEEAPLSGESGHRTAPAPDVFLLGDQTLPDAIRDLEINVLRQALEATRYHQGEAAERVGLTYHQFRGLYRKHQAALDDGGANPNGPAKSRKGETGTRT